MKSKNYYFFFFLSLTLCIFQKLPAQKNIDSLLKLVAGADGIKKVEHLNALAEAYFTTDPDHAVTTADLAYQTAKNLDDLELQARASRILADAWYYKNDFLKAIDYYKIAAEADKALNGEDSKFYFERLGDIGYCYDVLFQYDLSEEYYGKALALARKIDDDEEIANNLNNLGHINFSWGNYDKAISLFIAALQIDQKRNIEEYISIDYNNIGKVYFSWGKYDEAIEYYTKALEMAEATNNSAMQAIRLSNLGQAYEAMGDFDQALVFLNKALDIDNQLGNREKTGIRWCNIGRVFLKQKKYKEAQHNFNEALSIFKEANYYESQAITFNLLGELMFAQKKYNEALQYFDKSLKISDTIGLRPQKLHSLKSLSDTYAKMGNYEKSLLYYTGFSALKDSMFNEEKHRQLAEFEVRYKTEKKEKENTILKQKAKIRIKQMIIFIILGVAMLVVAVLFIFLFTIKRKSLIQNRKLHSREKELHQLEMEKKEKENDHLQQVLFAEEKINKLQQEKLKQKNRELSTATLHILNKNEVLGNIRKIAKTALADKNASQNDHFKKLIDEIDNNTNLDEQWNQFKMHFESVHKGFFEKLRNKFPHITQNELKLCAYLKMNLSTKEIAQMLNIGIESVNTKRYRLRKKLHLDNEQNLVAFISSF